MKTLGRAELEKKTLAERDVRGMKICRKFTRISLIALKIDLRNSIQKFTIRNEYYSMPFDKILSLILGMKVDIMLDKLSSTILY